MRSPLPIVIALLVAAPAVGQEFQYGPESPLGQGTARTYVIVGDGRPLELGIALSESALEGLPDLADVPPEHEAFVLIDLPLPAENPTPFRLASMDWNPRGHPPVMYGLPHFDFHFYLIDAEVRDAILPGDPPDLVGFEGRGSRAPEEGLLPVHYVYPGEATVPQMGGHWVDPASHEFHGEEFDTTFIYGTWDGGIIFWEPMITRTYIESRHDATIKIATPARVANNGWYPSAYRVSFDPDAKEYRIALVGFVRM
jgi:hypothetical protein